MNRKNSEERFFAPPTPAVSPPRYADILLFVNPINKYNEF